MGELVCELVDCLKGAAELNARLKEDCAPGSTEWLQFDAQESEAVRLIDLLEPQQ